MLKLLSEIHEIKFLIHGDEEEIRHFTKSISYQLFNDPNVDHDQRSGVQMSGPLTFEEIREKGYWVA